VLVHSGVVRIRITFPNGKGDVLGMSPFFSMAHDGWGPCMPARDWPDFLEAHYRPHLLVVDLGTASTGTHGRRLVRLLSRLVDSLGTSGDYAVSCDGQEARVAFESDVDARTLGKLLAAREIEHGGKDWASKSVCNLDSRLKIVRRPKQRPLH